MAVFGYGLDPFGFGPYGGLGGVLLPATTPPLGGYGGYGYGINPYGALGGFGGPVIAVTGGYGGYAYGQSSYGSIDSLDGVPSVLSAVSVTGFLIEVFFSQEMSSDADLFDPTSYTLTPLIAAAASTVLSVEAGVAGTWGLTSVLLHHTGTTLGGLYHLTVVGPRDIGGTEIAAYAPLNQTDVLCKGEAPSFTITPISGSELLYEFEFEMLDEASFSPGILQLDAYGFETEYPQNLVPTAVEHPYTADARLVKVDVLGMTSTNYVGIVSPATAITYPASYLPNAPQAEFTAQQLGTGTTVQGTGEVFLGAGFGFAYGWRFLDLSGRLVPDSSYRLDVTFDASGATITPAPYSDVVLLVLVSDGALEVSLSFRRVAGIDTVEVQSGVFSASASINWTANETTVSVVRNQQADSYTIVLNGEPIVAGLTGAFTGPAGFPAGVQFFLDPVGAYDIQSFSLREILLTATQTIFSAAWNFLHNQQALFLGSNALTRPSLLTAKGPLVKGWGDATPATEQDVVVYVNGTAVEISGVNPYYGAIFLVIPIPLMPPGEMTVEVDYIWFPAPIMEFSGLNTIGLVLNKYDCKPLCPEGGWSTGVGLPGGGTGGLEFSRFPMGIVLGPRAIRSPLLRSPRFVAFQKPYTASLNSPTTLLLNRNPHQVALSDEDKALQGQVVFYEGSVDPTVDPTNPWVLVGENDIDTFDSTGLEPPPPGIDPDATLAGFFQIWKVTTGSFGTGVPGFYERATEVPSPSSVVMVARFQVRTDGVTDTGTPLPVTDGVFTGVGFGCHTNTHLYLVGALLINSVQHVGMLVEPAFPEQASAWQLAYGVVVRILTATTFRVQSSALPQLVRERVVSDDLVRFQILEGTQSGVYELLEIVDQTDGTSTCTISTPFPVDASLFGNRDFTVYFETRWDGDGQPGRPTTYRLVVKNDIKGTPQGFAELFIGGAFTGKALELDGAPAFAIPPDGVLQFPTGNVGETFFGSLDRQASNLSDWYFVRYAVDPGVTTLNFRQIVVSAEMNSLPENDPNNIWFLTQEFGSRIIDVTGDQLLLKATCADNQLGVEGQDLTIGYARVEPFLTRNLAIDVDSVFQLDSGVLGAGDMQWIVRDGVREIRLATILYQESITARSLLNLPNLSLSGLLLPTDQGWTKTGDLASARVQGHRLEFSQEFGQTLTYALDLLDAGAAAPPSESRILEARIQVSTVTTTDLTGNTGIIFGSDVGPLGAARGIGVELRVSIGSASPQVSLFSLSTGLEVAAFDVAWDDTELHTYRAIADVSVNTVTLVVDDAVLGTADFTLFTLSSTDTQATLGFLGTTTIATVTVEDLSVVVLPPTTAHRTMGVYLGGDGDDINNWQLPRTDSLDIPNSNLSATIEEMDWRSRIRIRIHRDPLWGATILRPDLPPPPYFTGDFATQFTEPSAGWINVEYPFLPPVPAGDTFGYVAFGGLDPRSIMQARIDDVRYRIYRYATENIIMPPHMVLNQYNVVTSGEIQKDITVENYTVISTDSQTISLRSTDIVADRVFNFSFVNSAGRTVTYLPGSFVFNKDTQTITITSEQTLGFYPSQDVPDPVDATVDNPSLNDSTDFVFPLAVTLDPLDPDFVADTRGYPLDTRVAVTVNFAPGPPYTRTYVCSQPLLDGTTLLNEGTPPFETTQVGTDVRFLAWGSRINDPNDTLNNDPDFVLNDPFRFIDFSVDPKIQYEQLEFCEVSEGESCRLSPFCDENTPGAAEAGFSGNEPGDIGNGLIGMAFSGFMFTETEPITFNDGPSNASGNLTSSVFLHASGDSSPPGGNLNEAILFTPLGPSTPNFMGPDGSVGWSVFGQLYDTMTNTTIVLFFSSGSIGP